MKAKETHQGVAFTGLEGDALMAHGLGVEMGEGVGGAAEGAVERPVHFVQRRGGGFPLLRHRREGRENGSGFWKTLNELMKERFGEMGHRKLK